MKNIFLFFGVLCLSFTVFGQQKIQFRSDNKVECAKSDMRGLMASFSFSTLDASKVETSRGEPQLPMLTKIIDDPCASDLGYASVNFSENTGNYFPDMCYSCISVENDSQLTNYLNKVLTYEKFQFTDCGDYFP